MLKEEEYIDSALEFKHDLRDKPLNPLHKKICWRDGRTRRTTEYTVIDCSTSVLNGDYVVLKDGQGGRKQITATKFHEIRDARLQFENSPNCIDQLGLRRITITFGLSTSNI